MSAPAGRRASRSLRSGSPLRVALTLHFADPASAAADPWVLGVFRTSYAGDGYASEDGELWTQNGRLVLQARQLRRILQRV